MNAQQAFDGSLFGIRKQEYRRATNGSGCVYLVKENAFGSKEGDRCGIGHIMSAALANDACDYGDTITGFLQCKTIDIYPRVKEELGNLDAEFLGLLQRAHDKYLAQSVEAFEQRMQELAVKHNLTYTPPENTNVC